MTKIETLQAEISLARIELHKAQTLNAEALAAVGGSEKPDKAMATAKTTARLVADLQSEIAILDQARAAAETYQSSDEAKALKAKARTHKQKAESLVADCQAAADAIDVALTQLAQANVQWVDACRALKVEVAQFYRIALSDNQNARIQRGTQLAGLENAISNVAVCKFDLAMVGVNLYPHGKLRYSYDPMREQTARHDAKWILDSIMGQVQFTAKEAGVPTRHIAIHSWGRHTGGSLSRVLSTLKAQAPG